VILLWMILIPFLTALMIAVVPMPRTVSRWLGGISSALTVLIGGYLWFQYPAGYEGYLTGRLFEVQWAWFPAPIGASFHLGVDGISLLFAVLTAVLSLLVVMFSWESVQERADLYYVMVMILTGSLFGVFFARDLLLFYLFWEAMLIPMYFIIGIWGGRRRIYASMKFVVYTLVGSLLMLVSIVVLHSLHLDQFGPSMALADLYRVDVPASYATWVFLGFLLSFAIKTPLVPLHTWLPDAHVEAPTPGSVILAGILLKVGIYGFIRLLIPIFPALALQWAGAIALLAVIGILYGGLVAWVQTDIKKLVAYSSVSHLGFVVLGLFALNVTSVTGGLLQGVIHGINTGALFLIVGMVYQRSHDREIESISGLATQMPVLSTFLVIASFASIGMPGTNGFVGEFMILTASFRSLPWLTMAAAAGVVVSAMYMLRLLRSCVFGTVSESVSGLSRLNLREIFILLVLTAGMFWLGLYPAPALDRLEPSVRNLLEETSPALTETAAESTQNNTFARTEGTEEL
jgi:NADH-quinone oxidoreductase subunit M